MLRLDSLSKKYGKMPVLEKVSFEIRKGDFALLVGRNGVGKSTLLKILAGLENADSGVIHAECGIQICVVSEDIVYHPYFDVATIVKTTSPFYVNWSEAIYQEHLSNCTFKSNSGFTALSRGQKTQLQLCLALASQPDIILIDEATVTLDPLANDYFLNALKIFTKKGGAIIFATNSFTDINYCDFLLHIDQMNKLHKVVDTNGFDPSSIEGDFN